LIEFYGSSSVAEEALKILVSVVFPGLVLIQGIDLVEEEEKKKKDWSEV
jgi:hypothetical protein